MHCSFRGVRDTRFAVCFRLGHFLCHRQAHRWLQRCAVLYLAPNRWRPPVQVAFIAGGAHFLELWLAGPPYPRRHLTRSNASSQWQLWGLSDVCTSGQVPAIPLDCLQKWWHNSCRWNRRHYIRIVYCVMICACLVMGVPWRDGQRD